MGVIRGLDRFLRDRKLVHSSALADFRGCALGLDAVAWFKASPVVKEPLLAALGGQPIALRATLASQLQAFERSGIRPVFVFGGLIPPRGGAGGGAGGARGGAGGARAPPASGGQPPVSNKFYAKRHEAWTAYEDGSTRTAAFLFGQAGGYVSLDVQAAICDALRETAGEASFFRSPYAAPAQLAWMSAEEQGFVHAAFGGLELLLFGVPRVVLEIKAGRVEWVALDEVLRALEFTHEQFVDMCLLAGYGRCRTFDPVMDEKRRFAFDRAHMFVRRHGSADDAAREELANPDGYLGMLRASRVVVRHQLVLQPGCRCAPLRAPASAADRQTLEAASGPVFPPEVYAMLVKGVVSPQVLNNLLNGVLIDSAPAVDSREYAAFLDSMTPLRYYTFAALHHALRRRGCETRRRIVNKRWYDPVAYSTLFNADTPVDDRNAALLAGEPAARAAVAAAAAAAAPSLEGAYGVLEPLLALGGDAEAGAGAGDGADPAAGAAVSFLVLAGFAEVAGDGVAPTALGRAAAAAGAGTGGAAADEALLLASQLVAAGSLTGEPVSLLTPEGSVFFASVPSPDGRVPLSRPARLVAQVCSLMPVRASAPKGSAGWTGPVDRELAAFGAVAKSLQRCSRNLVEALALAAALDRNRPAGADLRTLLARFGGGVSLPLAAETGSAAGLMAIDFCARGMPLEDMARRYPQATHVREDVAAALAHWQRVVALVREWPAAAPSRAAFDEADAFVRDALRARGLDLETFAPASASAAGAAAEFNDTNFWKPTYSYLVMDDEL